MVQDNNFFVNWNRGKEFLGSEYPLMAGAMSWISERNLVSAISNEGGFGVVACGSMSPDLLDTEIKETKKLTSRNFGVNLIIMHPQLSELVDVCLDNGVSHIILAGGFPKKTLIQKIVSADCKTLSIVPSLSIAKRVIGYGVSGIIIEGMEAGGHIGSVSTSVLAQEIIPHVDEVPVFVAGGIGHGKIIESYVNMGASGCQMGTIFACSKESIAHSSFKNAMIGASARNAVVSTQVSPEFPVIPVRAIENKACKEFVDYQHKIIADYKDGKMPLKDAQLEIEKFWAGSLRRAVIEGDVDYGSLMAGQSVGMVTSEKTVKEIISEILGSISEDL